MILATKLSKLEINEKIKEYEYLVKSIVSKFNIPSGYEREDILSFALEGLYRAIITYDESKSSKFEMYARCKIYNEIVNNIRATSFIPRSILDKKKKYEKAVLDLENKYKRTPTKEELMEHMGITETVYNRYLDSFSYGISFSVNDIFSNSSTDMENRLYVDNNNSFDSLEKKEFKSFLIKALDNFSDTEKKVFYLKYYYGLTYKDISKIVNVSEYIVSEIHNRCIIYLKSALMKLEGKYDFNLS